MFHIEKSRAGLGKKFKKRNKIKTEEAVNWFGQSRSLQFVQSILQVLEVPYEPALPPFGPKRSDSNAGRADAGTLCALGAKRSGTKGMKGNPHTSETVTLHTEKNHLLPKKPDAFWETF